MQRSYRLSTALLETGWAEDVEVAVSADGIVSRIDAGPADRVAGDAELIRGIVVPGMPNGHSHAFQRAMAGGAEFRLSARDSFWTWRRPCTGSRTALRRRNSR